MQLYEKRREYTRTRMVRLAAYLVADSVEAYRADHFDGDNVEAVFDPAELADGPRVPAVHPLRPHGAAAPVVAGVLPAERDRALPQRPDRRARRASGAAGRRRADGRGRDRDARAGRRPDRLHRQPVAAPRSPDTRAPATRTETRTRSASSSSTRSSSRSCTARRTSCNEYCKYYKNVENPHYKFIPMVSPRLLRRDREPRDGHRQHQRRGVRGDAEAVRRRVAARATSRTSPSRWTASSTRSSRRRTARSSATSRSSGSPSTSTAPAT